MTIITHVPPRATEVSEGHRVVLSRVVSGRHLSEIPSKSIHHSGYAIDEFGRIDNSNCLADFPTITSTISATTISPSSTNENHASLLSTIARLYRSLPSMLALPSILTLMPLKSYLKKFLRGPPSSSVTLSGTLVYLPTKAGFARCSRHSCRGGLGAAPPQKQIRPSGHRINSRPRRTTNRCPPGSCTSPEPRPTQASTAAT
jgi:hypothetical protein